jgi:hypothetical protein
MVLFGAMLIYWISLLPIPFQVLIAATMYRRKQHLVYPAFWAFVIFECMRSIVEAFLALSPRSRAYFIVYWGSGFLDALFVLAILREIFVKVLADYSTLTRFRRRGYEIALAVITLGAVAVSAQAQGRSFFTREIIQAQQTVALISLGMLLFVALSSIVLGIRWRSELCGIACGVGLLGMGDVLVFTSSLFRAKYTRHMIGWVETIAYDAAFLLFAAYFLVPQKESEKPEIRPDLAEWARSMSESLPK